MIYEGGPTSEDEFRRDKTKRPQYTISGLFFSDIINSIQSF